MRRNRSLAVTATASVAALVMGLSACGGSGSEASSSGSASDGQFVVGGLFPLTGSLADLGPAAPTAAAL
ncbi:MAG: amino acid ABC transporter substrate-binding protein, partial [Bifidobacterium crudilactis]|nr:amino acid ABC transporter substrate-binding protein [Bifidobacterium crudilactis]